MNTTLHAVSDSQGRPISFFVTAGQVSDYIGARALLSSPPNVDWLLGDRGYDADWFREAMQDRGLRLCIPGRKSRAKAVRYDKRRYERRNRIEIMFGRLKDWRRVATRYDRCPKVFLSAIALAATVIYWLSVLTIGSFDAANAIKEWHQTVTGLHLWSACRNTMIHSTLNGRSFLRPFLTYWGWTNGCVAVTNAEMREIWSMVPNGTPITIQD